MGNTAQHWDLIFKTGIHTSSNGLTRSWSDRDLDRLVANTKEAPIVIRHPKDQARAFEFGKIACLRRFGDELQAQYRDVPEILSMAVKEGLNLAKSVSIDPVKMVIRHVGLLGAGQDPAVAGLGPVNFEADHAGDALLTYTMNQSNFEKKEAQVDPKDEKIRVLESENKALAEKIKGMEAGDKEKAVKAELDHATSELKTEKEAHDATKAEFAKFKQEQEDTRLQDRVDALAESGRILPGEKEKVLGFAKAMADSDKTMEFSAPDGTKTAVTPRENYLRDLEARPGDKDGLLSEFAVPDRAGSRDDGCDEVPVCNM